MRRGLRGGGGSGLDLDLYLGLELELQVEVEDTVMEMRCKGMERRQDTRMDLRS